MKDSDLNIQVFLAEDDEDDRLFFREMLSEINNKIGLLEFEDGIHLIEYLNHVDVAPPPHLIFLDINMPLKTGIECLKEIRSKKIFCDVPVIMFTTSSNHKDIDSSFNCGANLYIRKPNSIKEGINTLSKIFEDYAAKILMKVPKDKYFIG